MKKKSLSALIALTLACSMMLSSCVGTFSLTNKLLDWNRQVGNKFVNELVFFAFWVLPVYEVSSLADLLVLNTIEFWSGSNPIAKNTKKEVKGTNGERYLVERDQNGYTVTNCNNKTVTRLDYNKTDDSWYVTTDGQTYKLLTFVDENHVMMPTADGDYIVVELSKAGLVVYEAIAQSSRCLMASQE